ncbi:MAG: HAD hydrolase-like protein, partial [Ruminococcus sp.]|nr:HAD hydrolase-like protein [Ruminococcus sp.]
DMDGVIFDSERAYIDAYRKLAEKYGLGDVEQACIDSIGVTRELTKKIFFEHVGYKFDYDKYREEVQQELN